MAARMLGPAVLCCCLSLVAAAPAMGQAVADFYRGRTVTLIVGTAPGGINDISARLVARHLGRFVPGQPTIIVQNMPGAGGLVLANRIYNTAEKDGSVFAKLERAVPQLAIQGDRNANFDPMKFTWLGSLSSYANDAYVLLVNTAHPARTVADLLRPNISVSLGADNSASSNLIFALLAREVLGLHVNVVRGYTGAAPLFLAMQRGELDGQMVGLSSVKTGQRDLWNRQAFRPLLQFGRNTRLAELSDVPVGRELAGDAEARALIEFAELPFFMALPFAAPPGMPAERAKALQSAFMEMCRDKDFIAEAERLGLDVSPIGADGVLDLLARSTATPQEVIARYNALVARKN
ncbi:MAG: Bug family tripartite tricarboxylate transporter substrate binding protein [Xanthobacteraceae bacterium]